uniref:Uncharacterized protein n=1 Tax=Alexandrium monilatum TaxID=311494 RepID=A0A7S4SDL3_9DINO|mmetsp:Transcript_28526/g.89931  ORF Transcript_28526/g.89931 Transcript_28526/m.89931 type:complete len:362 (-) Transcript_28526:233-1318(-)
MQSGAMHAPSVEAMQVVPAGALAKLPPPPAGTGITPARCRGVTKAGARCSWTAAAGSPVVAPLLSGSHYCSLHLAQDLERSGSPRQQPLERFFPRQKEAEELRAVPSPARSTRAALTREEHARIEENRRAALERRSRRMAEDLLGSCSAEPADGPRPTSNASAPGGAGCPGAPSTLTREQQARIAESRRRALERRRQRAAEGADDEAPRQTAGAGAAAASSEGSATPVVLQQPLGVATLGDAQPSQTTHMRTALTQEQRWRIEEKRSQAFERQRRRRGRERVADGAPAAEGLVTPVAGGAGSDLAPATARPTSGQTRSRSRTPPRRQRRLVACITGSPLPLPSMHAGTASTSGSLAVKVPE